MLFSLVREDVEAAVEVDEVVEACPVDDFLLEEPGSESYLGMTKWMPPSGFSRENSMPTFKGLPSETRPRSRASSEIKIKIFGFWVFRLEEKSKNWFFFNLLGMTMHNSPRFKSVSTPLHSSKCALEKVSRSRTFGSSLHTSSMGSPY